jgi:signal peptidase I
MTENENNNLIPQENQQPIKPTQSVSPVNPSQSTPSTQPIKSKDSIANLKRIAKFIFDVFKGVILLFILVILIRIFILQPFIVDGPSMEPSFYNGEYLLVDKITPRISNYSRGNVIVFKYPKNQQLDFIKRVIGLPGDTVEISNGKITIVNSANPEGQIISEPYLALGTQTITSNNNFSQTLGNNEYFVMGDNRNDSLDSRDFGVVKKNLIIGRVWFSFRTFKTIPKINYPDLSFINNLSFKY